MSLSSPLAPVSPLVGPTSPTPTPTPTPAAAAATATPTLLPTTAQSIEAALSLLPRSESEIQAIRILKKKPVHRTASEHQHVHEWLTSAHPRLFHEFSTSVVRELVTRLKYSVFARREIVFHQGDEADAMYVLIRGSVSMWALPIERKIIPKSINETSVPVAQSAQPTPSTTTTVAATQPYASIATTSTLSQAPLTTNTTPRSQSPSTSPSLTPQSSMKSSAATTSNLVMTLDSLASPVSSNRAHSSRPPSPPPPPPSVASLSQSHLTSPPSTSLHASSPFVSTPSSSSTLTTPITCLNRRPSMGHDGLNRTKQSDTSSTCSSSVTTTTSGITSPSSAQSFPIPPSSVVNPLYLKRTARSEARDYLHDPPILPPHLMQAAKEQGIESWRAHFKMLGILHANGPKVVFGESGLLQPGASRSATIRAEEMPTETLTVEKADFDRILAGRFHEDLNAKYQMLCGIQLFQMPTSSVTVQTQSAISTGVTMPGSTTAAVHQSTNQPSQSSSQPVRASNTEPTPSPPVESNRKRTYESSRRSTLPPSSSSAPSSSPAQSSSTVSVTITAPSSHSDVPSSIPSSHKTSSNTTSRRSSASTSASGVSSTASSRRSSQVMQSSSSNSNLNRTSRRSSQAQAISGVDSRHTNRRSLVKNGSKSSLRPLTDSDLVPSNVTDSDDLTSIDLTSGSARTHTPLAVSLGADIHISEPSTSVTDNSAQSQLATAHQTSLKKLVLYFESRVVPPRHVIVQQYQPARFVYCIVKGEVELLHTLFPPANTDSDEKNFSSSTDDENETDARDNSNAAVIHPGPNGILASSTSPHTRTLYSHHVSTWSGRLSGGGYSLSKGLKRSDTRKIRKKLRRHNHDRESNDPAQSMIGISSKRPRTILLGVLSAGSCFGELDHLSISHGGGGGRHPFGLRARTSVTLLVMTREDWMKRVLGGLLDRATIRRLRHRDIWRHQRASEFQKSDQLRMTLQRSEPWRNEKKVQIEKVQQAVTAQQTNTTSTQSLITSPSFTNRSMLTYSQSGVDSLQGNNKSTRSVRKDIVSPSGLAGWQSIRDLGEISIIQQTDPSTISNRDEMKDTQSQPQPIRSSRTHFPSIVAAATPSMRTRGHGSIVLLSSSPSSLSSSCPSSSFSSSSSSSSSMVNLDLDRLKIVPYQTYPTDLAASSHIVTALSLNSHQLLSPSSSTIRLIQQHRSSAIQLHASNNDKPVIIGSHTDRTYDKACTHDAMVMDNGLAVPSGVDRSSSSLSLAQPFRSNPSHLSVSSTDLSSSSLLLPSPSLSTPLSPLPPSLALGREMCASRSLRQLQTDRAVYHRRQDQSHQSTRQLRKMTIQPHASQYAIGRYHAPTNGDNNRGRRFRGSYELPPTRSNLFVSTKPFDRLIRPILVSNESDPLPEPFQPVEVCQG